MEFLATSAERAGCTVLAMSGEVDVQRPGLRSRIGDLFDSGHRRLVVDFSGSSSSTPPASASSSRARTGSGRSMAPSPWSARRSGC